MNLLVSYWFFNLVKISLNRLSCYHTGTVIYGDIYFFILEYRTVPLSCGGAWVWIRIRILAGSRSALTLWMDPDPGSVWKGCGSETLPWNHQFQMCTVKQFASDQCCGSESESGSESERIRAFLAGTESESESEIFVPDSDSDPDPDPDSVPDPVI